MSVNDQYALNWSNHTAHIRKAFDTLLSENQFVDVTLSCEGKKLLAHKIILSACSTYFHDLFRDNPCQHPIVILKDVKFQNLFDILKFIYNGEVSVSSDNFDSFLKTAELLQISGLTDDDGKQLDESTTTNENTDTTPSIAESAPKIIKSTHSVAQSSASTSLPQLTKSPITKKRPMETTSSEEPTMLKKKRENMLDIEIKEEIAEGNFEEEDDISSIIDIKDPLQIEQHDEHDPNEGLVGNFQGLAFQELTKVREIVEKNQLLLNQLVNQQQFINISKLVAPINLPSLPIVSEEEFDSFELLLEKDQDIYQYMIKRLASIGGLDIRSATRKMLKFLLKDIVAVKFNWKGRDKRPFHISKLMALIFAQQSYPEVKDLLINDPNEIVSCSYKLQESPSVFPNGLRCHLQSSREGKMLLCRTDEFTEGSRGELCKIIIDFLFERHPNYKISTSTFLAVADEITDVFPTENSSTYYIPYRKKTRTSSRVLASGKLWSKYVNYKKKLKEFECSSSDRYKNKTEDSETSLNIRKTLFETDLSLRHWKSCKSLREAMLKRNRNSSIGTYFEKFPVLKQPDGYRFLLDDFNEMFPLERDNLFSIWPTLSIKWVQLAVKLHKIDLTNYLFSEDVTSLFALVSLFPPITFYSKKLKANVKPLQIETQEAFMLVIDDAQDLFKKIRSHTKSVLKYTDDVQPFFVICMTGKVIVSCHVIVQHQIYNANSPLDALDKTFKSIFALNTHYPPECAHIWTFIQKYIYGITTNFDRFRDMMEVVRCNLDL